MEVAIPPRVPTHQVTVSMKLANIQSDVTVSATEQTAEAGGLTQTLSQDEIDQLPDDEEELRRMLEEIAGPGAMIRVDGFSGRRLPTRDQIARIVVRRDAFSAEFHQVGQAGSRSRRGPASIAGAAMQDSTFGPVSLPPATRPRARRAKPGTMVRVNAFAAGPLVRNRISFSSSIEGSSSEDSRGISALTPTGPFLATIPQSFDSRAVSVRSEGLLTRQTMFRLSYERDTSERANQGISELDLPERGYTSDSVQHELRFARGRTAASLPSALSVRSVAQRATPDTVAPAIVVQNAFRAGGASVSGGDRGRSALSIRCSPSWRAPTRCARDRW